MGGSYINSANLPIFRILFSNNLKANHLLPTGFCSTYDFSETTDSSSFGLVFYFSSPSSGSGGG